MRRIGLLVPTVVLLALCIGCGDQYRPVANPIIGSGGQPQNTHYAFVVSYNPIGNSSTTRIDVSGDTNLEVQPVGAGAVAESFLANNTGALLTANSLADSVSEFPTSFTNSAVTTINVPAGSKPVLVTTNRTGFVYTINSSPNANCPQTGSISVIDTTALTVVSTVCVGQNPIFGAQLPNGNQLYVINQGDNSISVYNPNTLNNCQNVPNCGISKTITTANGLGLNPVYLSITDDSEFVFVVTAGDGTNPGALNIIATSDDTVRASIPLGISPNFSYIDPILNRLYVTNGGSNSVTAFDISNVNLANNPPIPTLATTTVGSKPVGVTALQSSTKFYTVNSNSNDVTVLSATSFGVLKTVPVGQNPTWIASEPSSTKIYAANTGSGTVSIIQTENDTVVDTMNMPQQNPACTSSCALQQPRMILTF